MKIVLYILSFLAFALGVTVWVTSVQSALIEIVAMQWFLISTMLFCAGAIIGSLKPAD